MMCMRCSFLNPEGMNFCGECGNRLVFSCKNCGKESLTGVSRCVSCDKTAESWETPFSETAERKFITVLFSDLSGYTAMSETLPPEEVKKIMSLIFGRIAATVKRYGGTIDKFMGDAALALFGMPRAHEDDPVRAVGAAVEIHRIVEALGRKFREMTPAPLLLHTGIHTGFVITGEMKRKTRGVTGRTVNLAARLTSLARPGTIVVSDTTRSLTHKHWIFGKLPPVILKGILGSETLYKVRAPRKEPEKGDADTPPFIGRTHELARIEERVRSLSETPGGGIILVTGEAGIGKSRLIAEVGRRTKLLNLRRLEGRTGCHGEQPAYGPFVEILKLFFAISAEKPFADSCLRISREVERLFPEGAPELPPVLSSLMGLAAEEALTPPDTLKHHIFRSVRKFFLRLSEKSPLLLVFEDLQWADNATLDLLHHLFPLTETRPLLFFCVSRMKPPQRLFYSPEERHTHKLCSHTLHVELSPLSPMETAKLTSMIEADHGYSGGKTIVEYSGGNPFFVEELLRSLHSGPDNLKSESITAEKRDSNAMVPASLRGLILDRFDRLDKDLKSLLKIASVIGPEFSRAVLVAVNRKEVDVDQIVEKLMGEGFISPAATLPEKSYVFHHSLFREVIYDSIPMDEQRGLHRKTARAYETLFSCHWQEFHEKLAFHYSMGEVWEKAHHYLFKAGEKSGNVAADTEALGHFRKAKKARQLVFGSDQAPHTAAVMERKMGEALFRQGEHRKAAECFLRALLIGGMPLPVSIGKTRLSIAGQVALQTAHRFLPFFFTKKTGLETGNSTELLKLLESMGWIDYFTNRERFFLVMTMILNLAEKRGNLSAMARGFMGMGMTAGKMGLFRLSSYYNRKAFCAARMLDTPMVNALCILGDAIHDEFRGKLGSSCEKYLKSSEIYMEAKDMRRWGTAAIHGAFVHNLMGRFGESLELAEKVNRAGLAGGDAQLIAWGSHVKGLNLLYRGSLDAAEASLFRAVHLLDRIPDPYDGIHARSSLAECLIRQKKPDRALHLLEETLELIGSNRLRGPKVALSHATLAECALLLSAEGEGLKKAGKLIRQALKQARRFNCALPGAYRAWGRYLHLKGRTKKAQRIWKRGLNCSEKLGTLYESGKTLLTMGIATGEQLYIQQAKEVFHRTGAKLDSREAAHELEKLTEPSGGKPARIVQQLS